MSAFRKVRNLFVERGALGTCVSIFHYCRNRTPSYTDFVVVLLYPIYFKEYFSSVTGSQYGLGFTDKLVLAWRIRRTALLVSGWRNYAARMVIATKMLQIPAERGGVIVECGSYKGSSTSAWSLVADEIDRELHVFDSFAGLPEPDEDDRRHQRLDETELSEEYSEGQYKGDISTVRQNIDDFGRLERCTFHEGFFEESLPGFDEPVVFVYTDVDLRSSLEVCLSHLWDNVQPESYWFTHEGSHVEIASLFFDEEWWQENVDTDPPMLMGSGSGIAINPKANGCRSNIAYTIKNKFT